jgi:hypothetical protein
MSEAYLEKPVATPMPEATPLPEIEQLRFQLRDINDAMLSGTSEAFLSMLTGWPTVVITPFFWRKMLREYREHLEARLEELSRG